MGREGKGREGKGREGTGWVAGRRKKEMEEQEKEYNLQVQILYKKWSS